MLHVSRTAGKTGVAPRCRPGFPAVQWLGYPGLFPLPDSFSSGLSLFVSVDSGLGVAGFPFPGLAPEFPFPFDFPGGCFDAPAGGGVAFEGVW